VSADVTFFETCPFYSAHVSLDKNCTSNVQDIPPIVPAPIIVPTTPPLHVYQRRKHRAPEVADGIIPPAQSHAPTDPPDTSPAPEHPITLRK
ncbi:hypothetical protein A2U01_0071417, partial [Trifolium medium]|nr:hypothetical protein [Trifolium medium]